MQAQQGDAGQFDALLANVEKSVQDALAYFEGPGATSQVKVDQWGPRDVLCHFLFWHQATAEGMESVARGGQPTRLEASTDDMNARAIAQHARESIPQLVSQARQLQGRLVRAARSIRDLEKPVLVRFDGTPANLRQRLEIIARHWTNHVRDLRMG
ncbi:MAG: hypothetical protein HYY00_04600 [Chloroflexi bacterium]|nr:hypothetical protein [Chloroflexota bacterium]